MRRFVCNRWPQYRIWTNQGKEVKFHNGCFETDDVEIVAFLRSPAMAQMMDRFIREVEIEGPAHGEVPQQVPQVSIPESWYCGDCDKTFARKDLYDKHMKYARAHGGQKDEDPVQMQRIQEMIKEERSHGEVRSGEDP